MEDDEVLRQLVDEATTIVWEADITGRCIYLDPESAKAVAHARHVYMSDWARHIHPDDFEEASRIVTQARKDRRKYRHEYRVIRSDGTARWILSTAAPRVSPEGDLQGYMGTLVDISAHHESREKLIRSEAEHRLLTEHAGDMISYSDAENRYVYASPSHKDICGYDPEDLIGTYVHDYLHPEDLERETQKNDEQRGRLINIRAQRKDGTWLWISTSTRTIRDPHSGKKKGTVAIARDITAQVEAQRELARREERFRGLTSLSSDWYWETNADGRFAFVSEGIYSRLGLRPDEVLGTALHDTAHDLADPAFVECVRKFASRQAFKDLVFPVSMPAYPGVVRYIRISGEPFYEEGTYCGFRGATRDVTKEIRTAQELQRLATRDALTDLPNRAILDMRLKQRIDDRRGTVPQGFFFIDLDRFKEVNDSLGHAFGDALLKEIAARLRRCLRPDDILARLGGDEFILVASCRKGTLSAVRIAEKLIASLAEPFIIAHQELRATASIGISMYPHDAETSEALMQNADTALYRAKAQGGGQFCFFTAEMREEARMRLMLQLEMRHAIKRNEFEIHYQPRVNLKTLEITGMEALLRWNHPQLGAIPPIQFIPLAEETGFINEIGEWVLQHAAHQAQAWNRRYGQPLRVSVNLSPRQLRDEKLVSFVTQALEASGLPGELLELEITESALMEDPDLAARVLQELKSFGIQLSVDDFGTGYSSLAYLRRFPIDCLKLDRSFLRQEQFQDISPLVLAEAIINLAHALNLSVVAEGVELQENLEFLRTTSCDEVQGFWICKPVPANEFERLFAGVTAFPWQAGTMHES